VRGAIARHAHEAQLAESVPVDLRGR
jgi:hypothetical protein